MEKGLEYDDLIALVAGEQLEELYPLFFEKHDSTLHAE